MNIHLNSIEPQTLASATVLTFTALKYLVGLYVKKLGRMVAFEILSTHQRYPADFILYLFTGGGVDFGVYYHII
jgi:hypothetical protein